MGSLVERLAEEREYSIELRITVGELHTLHSALTAAATLFLSDGRFFDTLALGIAEAAAAEA
ncbi:MULTISPECIES: hypothetical protein [Streptomyces]|uniref:Uncharacterized protein n=2 Tax=Streptomyces TaxID=1883 RepID=A0ABV9J0M8_9ACTN